MLRMARAPRRFNWIKIIERTQTPLSFYVLALLIIESTMTIVLTAASFDPKYKWDGFLSMIIVFAAVVLIVTALTFLRPKNLLYSKAEHAVPQIEPSALRDQIEDIIFEQIKPECLKTARKELE